MTFISDTSLSSMPFLLHTLQCIALPRQTHNTKHIWLPDGDSINHLLGRQEIRVFVTINRLVSCIWHGNSQVVPFSRHTHAGWALIHLIFPSGVTQPKVTEWLISKLSNPEMTADPVNVLSLL